MRSPQVMLLAALPALVLSLSCGGGGGAGSSVSVPSPPSINISVTPAKATVKAGGQFSFRAVVSGSSNTAVSWQVDGVPGGNAGIGTVDKNGHYTAPSAPPSPPAVTVTAVAMADSTKSASSSVTVTIGISVAPAIASLLINTPECPVSQRFSATVAGASNSGVTWTLTDIPSGSAAGAFGTLSSDGIYVSPSTIPSPPNFSVTATSEADPTQSAVANVTVSAGGAVVDQRSQGAPVELGTSGGNSGDKSGNLCCSGTLGALVSRGGSNFILSNTHVLARGGQAVVGENITQPGLIDNRCSAGHTIANFTQATPLQDGSTAPADAALAEIVPDAVDATGAILQLGAVSCGRAQPAPPASTTVAASVGMSVAKSGRTTGLTCGTIGAVSVDGVKVDYSTTCGATTTFTVTYDNQIIVDTPNFSDSGDSGSLIVDADTAEPTALLFAGDASSGITVANPIQDALSALADPTSQEVPLIVGGDPHPVAGCSTAAAPQGMARPAISGSDFARARQAKNAHLAQLLRDPSVAGVGVGTAQDLRRAAVVVFVRQGQAHAPVPASLDGVPTQVREIGRLHAMAGNACPVATQVQDKLKSLR